MGLCETYPALSLPLSILSTTYRRPRPSALRGTPLSNPAVNSFGFVESLNQRSTGMLGLAALLPARRSSSGVVPRIRTARPRRDLLASRRIRRGFRRAPAHQRAAPFAPALQRQRVIARPAYGAARRVSWWI